MLLTRLANIDDMELYFFWANDPNVRKNAFSCNQIPWDIHQKWFTEKLADRNSFLYVIENNGHAIGQVRFDIIDDKAEIGYSMDKECRGKGYGLNMLNAAIDSFTADMGKHAEVMTLVAKVRENNIPSNKIFTGAGFDNKNKNENIIVYEFNLDSSKKNECL